MPSKKLLVAALAMLAGCSPAIGPDLPEEAGMLAFSYSGGVTGMFSASGVFSTDVGAANYAVGGRASNGTVIVASLPRTATTSDLVDMMIPRLTSGSSLVDVACLTADCARLVLLLGSPNADDGDAAQVCRLTMGTLTITTISDSRATGTFSGTGQCTSSTLATTEFAVTGGTFDVALVLWVIG